MRLVLLGVDVAWFEWLDLQFFGARVANLWWGEADVLLKVMAVFSVKMHDSLPCEIRNVVSEMQKGLSCVARGGQDC